MDRVVEVLKAVVAGEAAALYVGAAVIGVLAAIMIALRQRRLARRLRALGDAVRPVELDLDDVAGNALLGSAALLGCVTVAVAVDGASLTPGLLMGGVGVISFLLNVRLRPATEESEGVDRGTNSRRRLSQMVAELAREWPVGVAAAVYVGGIVLYLRVTGQRMPSAPNPVNLAAGAVFGASLMGLVAWGLHALVALRAQRRPVPARG